MCTEGQSIEKALFSICVSRAWVSDLFGATPHGCVSGDIWPVLVRISCVCYKQFHGIYLQPPHHIPIWLGANSWNSCVIHNKNPPMKSFILRLFFFHLRCQIYWCYWFSPPAEPLHSFRSTVLNDKSLSHRWSDLCRKAGSIFLSVSDSIVKQRVNSQQHLL